MKDKVFHVISNTHWDREWRFPFQKNRQMLVDMIDKTIDILIEEPDYRAFHLDSQSIVLDDYLEIKPHKKEIIKKLVSEGRLLIGPWYILPDEFHVGGENLIRNLLLGHRTCAEFGGVSKTGYSPFSWGQISQLPQIYKQFGVDVIMFYRGVNSLDSEKAEFLWEGSDGTMVLTSRFSTMPRYNFYFYIYRPVIHNEGFSDVELQWSKGGTAFHFSDSMMHDEDYSIINAPDTYYAENIIPSVKAIIEKQVNDFTTPHVIWMEGHDSSGPNRKTVRIIKDIKRLMPDVNVVHSTLEDYTNELIKNAVHEKLAIVKGERRSSQYDLRSGNLYGYITSARTYLKQKNFETETWLQRYAEPLNSLAGIYGMDLNDRYLDVAWNFLIQNSAHDSIGGCSLDEIHDDMMNRYKQTIEISRGVYERACKYFARRINLKKYPDNSIHLAVLNLTNYNRSEISDAFIDIPEYLDMGGVEIRDPEGNAAEFQLKNRSLIEPVVEQMTDRPMYFKMVRYSGYLLASKVPEMGLKTFHIYPSEKKSAKKEKVLSRFVSGFYILENDYLKIKINTNGTLKITDKENKRICDNIGYFFDEGEAGHAWVHKAAGKNADTLNAAPAVSIVENGPLKAVCLIEHELNVYKDLDSRQNKKGSKIKIPIRFYVSLTKTARFAEFDICLNNTAESHRLRFMMPSGIPADYSYAEGQFDVVKRKIDRIDCSSWVEQPMYDYPLYHFAGVSDGKAGAAFFVQGLTEYEVLDDKNRTIALTLIRGFKYVIAPSSVQDYSFKKGSQVLGEHRYKIAFYPHKGDWAEGNVYEEALKFNTPLSLFEIGKTKGSLKEQHSFLKIEPKSLIFSCLKKSENGKSFILRLYNPTDSVQQGKIKTAFKIDNASLVTLEEKEIGPLKVTRKGIEVIAQPKKIISIMIETA